MNSYYDDFALAFENAQTNTHFSTEITSSDSLNNYRPPIVESGTEALEKNNSNQQTASNCTKSTKLFLRTIDNKNFRLYTCSQTNIRAPFYQNKFCKLLTMLNPDQTLTITMGSLLFGNEPDISLGGMISSMLTCKAKIITYATGRCGMAESCLWLFGKERKISSYGALQFSGVKTFLKQFDMYTHYFNYIFNTAKELNIINNEQCNKLINTDQSFLIMGK